MAKNTKKPKKPEKSIKEQKKELEEKAYGQKNKKKSEVFKKQIKKLEQTEKAQRIQKKVEEKPKKKEKEKEVTAVVEETEPVKRAPLVCRFLIDALSKNVTDWKCPINCPDIHSLKEINNETQLSLEEYIELSRLEVTDHTPLTEETFKAWRTKKDLEDKVHEMRVQHLSTGAKLFEINPELFADDEDVTDINYADRCSTEEEEE